MHSPYLLDFYLAIKPLMMMMMMLEFEFYRIARQKDARAGGLRARRSTMSSVYNYKVGLSV